jgi:tetratricopeptide (TPR) repeat protein
MPEPSCRYTWPLRAAALALGLSAHAWATEGGVAAPDAAAQRVAEAEALAERAYEAYVARDYATAVALYSHAFERAPSADALFNIARIYDMGLRDRALAISFYRRYLSDPGASPDRIQRANVRLAELRLAEQAELAAPPAPEPAPRPVESEARPSDADGSAGLSSWQVAAIVVGATGAVATGLGAVYGVTVLSDAERANENCDGDRCRSQVGVDAARAASRHATLATWGIAAGAGLMASGALLWLLDPGAGDAARGDMRVDPIASASELGLALSGEW